ncbi:MAG: 5-histidylcysteine sulfoxide synthase [Campylobacterales bacterium]|nr:5-histidylcysteine sulfoxide synthase [Campylobacterales bacterium]
MSDFSRYPVTLDGLDVLKKREEIREYFHNTYDMFEKIFEVLKDDEVYYQKSEPTRHPMIFYFGHTATFFINKLFNMGIIDKRINPEFESIFAIGVDEMAWDDLNAKNYNWPKVSEVRSYRDEVRELVDELIMNIPLTLPIKESDAMWIVLMGIEHERIHIETSLVLHTQMPLEFTKKVKEFTLPQFASEPKQNELITFGATHIKLGKDKTHNLYGWDNEYGVYEEDVKEFKASKYLVSNAEFMEFVKDGGYENKEYWDAEGRKFLEIKDAKHPVFWVKDGDGFKYRTLCEVIDLPLNHPVEVNALEAMAYLRYKSEKDAVEYSLPSEAEYRVIYESVGLEDVLEFDERDANQNFAYGFGTTAVERFDFKTKEGEVIYDVVGNVWQWSRTPIFGFDGFEVHPAYDDFSTPTFDDKHALILGSSWASSGNLIMKYSRYAFRRHFPQFAGFRYVVSDAKVVSKNLNSIKDDEVMENFKTQYIDGEFVKECVGVASRYIKNKNKALDMGCGCGRGSYELAKVFSEVEGVDFSARFINVGVELKDGEVIECCEEKISLKTLGYDGVKDRVEFWQGDANNLKPNFNSYDFILATNLKDGFSTMFLDDVKNRFNYDGVVVFVTPKDKPVKLDGFKHLATHSLKDETVELSAWQMV